MTDSDDAGANCYHTVSASYECLAQAMTIRSVGMGALCSSAYMPLMAS